jgi:hypothetical protein
MKFREVVTYKDSFEIFFKHKHQSAEKDNQDKRKEKNK